jgi:hypothetical protein
MLAVWRPSDAAVALPLRSLRDSRPEPLRAPSADMSYFDGPSWQAPGRQGVWEQPPTPSRSGTEAAPAREDKMGTYIDSWSGASSAMPREEANAFLGQFEGMCCPLPSLKLFLPGPAVDANDRIPRR